jgi:hypothetical protein
MRLIDFMSVATYKNAMGTPNPIWLDNYLLRAVLPFPVFTLRSFGYKLRVAMSNDAATQRDSDFRVEAMVFSPDGVQQKEIKDLGIVRVGQFRTIDLESLILAEEERDQVIYVSLIPLEDEKSSSDGLHFRAERSRLRSFISENAHQIEYYRDDGYSTPVLVSYSPFNYKKFHANPPSTLLQAPKVFVSNEIETYLSLTNTSPEFDYVESHQVFLALSNMKGEVVASWIDEVLPFQVRLINLRQKLLDAGVPIFSEKVHNFVCSAICETGMLYPMLLTRNIRTNTLGFEHTFPPGVYSGAAMGPVRVEMNRRFRRSKLFKGIQI